MQLPYRLALAPGFALTALCCFSTTVFADETAFKAPLSATPSAISKAAPQELVAKVNGKPIYNIELQRALKVILAGQPVQQIPPDKLKEISLQAANQLVSAELLYQAGNKLDIEQLDKKIEAKIAEAKSKFPDSQEYDKAIKALGLDSKDLRDFTRRDLIISNFIEKTISPKAIVSEQESRTYYEQNLDKFSRGEAIRVSHILVGTDAAATEGEKIKARELADKLRKDLARGADFAKLAKENSTCPSSQQGGDLGFFGKNQMVPQFEAAAFALKQDEMSDVVETRFGFHIIKLTDKKSAETVTFKEAKARIDDYLKGLKINAEAKSYLTEARKSATIEMLLK